MIGKGKGWRVRCRGEGVGRKEKDRGWREREGGQRKKKEMTDKGKR